jgi:hypothetical protein
MGLRRSGRVIALALLPVLSALLLGACYSAGHSNSDPDSGGASGTSGGSSGTGQNLAGCAACERDEQCATSLVCGHVSSTSSAGFCVEAGLTTECCATSNDGSSTTELCLYVDGNLSAATLCPASPPPAGSTCERQSGCAYAANGLVCSCVGSSWSCDAQFACASGEFVPPAYQCDNFADCSDASDELGCASICGAFEYECSDGECIPDSWLCDGFDDCANGIDEFNCVTTCSSFQFACDDGYCIDETWVCDDYADCNDGTDELDCPATVCEAPDFECADGGCVPGEWICDGDLDCADGSDEVDCPVVACEAFEFQCTDGECIDEAWVCDAEEDCLDGSDELDCL